MISPGAEKAKPCAKAELTRIYIWTFGQAKQVRMNTFGDSLFIRNDALLNRNIIGHP